MGTGGKKAAPGGAMWLLEMPWDTAPAAPAGVQDSPPAAVAGTGVNCQARRQALDRLSEASCFLRLALLALPRSRAQLGVY